MSKSTKKTASKGSVPAEATSGGATNESTPVNQRAPVTKKELTKSKLDDGPDLGENGEYRPAKYKLPSGSVRVDR